MIEKRPIKVLQVVHGLNMGGAETWLMELLRLWSKSGEVRMDFLITGAHNGLFDEEARKLGARLYYVHYSACNLFDFVIKFRNILRTGQYDVIHDHADYASGWHFLMGLGALPSVRITHVHNPWIHIIANYAVNPRRKLVTAIGRWLVRHLATDVCGTSKAALDDYGFKSGYRGRLHVQTIHCGFNVKKFNSPRGDNRLSLINEFGFPPNAKIILFAGRLDRAMEYNHPQNHKNSWFALNIAKTALEKDAAVRFLMAGECMENREQLEKQINEWGFQNQLRIIGVRKDMSRLMLAADILLFPSRQEGLGMVAVEAQAAGLPVLSSATVPAEVVAVPEAVTFYRLEESIESWADEVLRLLKLPKPDPNRCNVLVSQSAFAIENSSNNLLRVYLSGEKRNDL